ncbi:ion transporter [Actinomyces wuliandei]|uniref:ion transporter n=1 Tax=Actinomyces wuliandei TaxID=2057743 RepID=UPI0019D4D12E|nr:ion transporter [Actinomyces wuliandei]
MAQVRSIPAHPDSVAPALAAAAPPEKAPVRTTWRQRLEDYLEAPRVQNLVMAVIVVNCVSIGLETAVQQGSLAYRALRLVDHASLTVFVTEIVLTLVAIGPSRFVRNGWHVFDFLVVAVALVPGAGPLSVLRTLRILRLLRVIKFLPSLRRVVEALLLSLPGISAIAALMTMIFYVAAVMATAMFGEAFPDWFGSLGRSLYTLFQVMTLESWSMGIVRPVMEHFPWAWAFFVPFILVSAFTMLNLFVAVIVDTMAQVGSSRETEKPEEAGDAAADPGGQPRPGPDPHPSQHPTTTETAEVLDKLVSEVHALRQEVSVLTAPQDPPGAAAGVTGSVAS